jgi:hypothetical protein
MKVMESINLKQSKLILCCEPIIAMDQIRISQSNHAVKLLEDKGFSPQGLDGKMEWVFVLAPDGKTHKFHNYIHAAESLVKTYYRGLETGSIYHIRPVQISGQDKLGEELKRWNWDMENWTGHIHDWDKTRKQIEEGEVIIEITKEEVLEAISNG